MKVFLKSLAKLAYQSLVCWRVKNLIIEAFVYFCHHLYITILPLCFQILGALFPRNTSQCMFQVINVWMLHPKKSSKILKSFTLHKKRSFPCKYFFIICGQIRRKFFYQVAVSRAGNNKKYLKINIYFNHSTLPFQASVTIT